MIKCQIFSGVCFQRRTKENAFAAKKRDLRKKHRRFEEGKRANDARAEDKNTH